MKPINPTGHSYSMGYSINAPAKIVFISGQVPETEDGFVPVSFYDQCKLVWQNIEQQVMKADMKLTDIAKITVFLSDRKYREENALVRREIFGDHQPALTVIIAGIYEEKWLLEIEVIASSVV
ncbi:MAG TPA: RidA family protein [Chitinophagaceae bacterium]|nr:RidA family protein [Chitinophagaceae bacterium]